MMPYVITLTGASQCGKSHVIDILHKLGNDPLYSGRDFHPVTFQKYTTRDFRDYEISAIINGKADILDQKPVIGRWNECEDLDSEQLRYERMVAFKRLKCDLAYEQFGDRYGLKLEDLYAYLKNCQTPIVVLNDVRTVEDIKTKLGGQCFSIFIFREAPNKEHFIKIGQERNEPLNKTEIRFKKAENIYRIYIENIHIFDKLILNVGDDADSLEKILRSLVEYLCQPMKMLSSGGRYA